MFGYFQSLYGNYKSLYGGQKVRTCFEVRDGLKYFRICDVLQRKYYGEKNYLAVEK